MTWGKLFRRRDDGSQEYLFLRYLDWKALPKDPEAGREMHDQMMLTTRLCIEAGVCFTQAVMSHKDASDKTGEAKAKMTLSVSDPEKPWEGPEETEQELAQVNFPARGVMQNERFGEDTTLPLSPIGCYVRKQIFMPIFNVLYAREQRDSQAIATAIRDAEKIISNLNPLLNQSFDALGYSAAEKFLHIPRIAREAKAAFLIATSPELLWRSDALRQIDGQREL